jgi:diaminopimelate epimerase
MRFVKMHGCGNDYVYLDAVRDAGVRARVGSDGWADLVRRMSDRHTGVGSDGVIALCPPTDAARAAGAAVRMRMFNADGSEAEMCGNGVRCVARFAHDRLGVREAPMRVETGRGVLAIGYRVEGGKLVEATVNMGPPVLDIERIPARREHLRPGARGEWTLDAGGRALTVSLVSMGNPHAVLFVDDAESFDLRTLGPLLETHPAFPNRINVHAASGTGDRVRVRTWERGAGITRACGTGACAVAVAGQLTGRLAETVRVRVDGGELVISRERDTHTGGPAAVLMTGPAVDVFEGDWLF